MKNTFENNYILLGGFLFTLLATIAIIAVVTQPRQDLDIQQGQLPLAVENAYTHGVAINQPKIDALNTQIEALTKELNKATEDRDKLRKENAGYVQILDANGYTVQWKPLQLKKTSEIVQEEKPKAVSASF